MSTHKAFSGFVPEMANAAGSLSGIPHLSADARRSFHTMFSERGLALRNESAAILTLPYGADGNIVAGNFDVYDAFYVRLRRLPQTAADEPFWALSTSHGGVNSVVLCCTATGALSIRNVGSANFTVAQVLGTSDPLDLDQFYFVQIRCRVRNDSIPRTPLVELKIDDSTICSVSGVASFTAEVGVNVNSTFSYIYQSAIGHIQVTGGPSAQGFEADIPNWIIDSSVYPTANRRTSMLLPSGPGTYTEWTAAGTTSFELHKRAVLARLANTSAPAGSFVRSDTNGQRITWAVESLASRGITGSVYSASVAFYALNSGAASIIYRRNGAETIVSVPFVSGNWHVYRLANSSLAVTDTFEIGVRNDASTARNLGAMCLFIEHDTPEPVATEVGDIVVLTGTHTGNDNVQTIDFGALDTSVADLVPEFIFVGPRSGTTPGAWWWKTMRDPSAWDNTLAAPGIVPYKGHVRFAHEAANPSINANGVVYTWIAIFDPKNRVLLPSSFVRRATDDNQNVSILQAPTFTPEGLFCTGRLGNTSNTLQNYYRGAGLVGDLSIRYSAGSVAALADAIQSLGAGTFQIGTLLIPGNNADIAYLAIRAAGFSLNNLIDITSYVGDGSSPRVIALDLGGQTPIWPTVFSGGSSANGQARTRYTGDAGRALTGSTTGNTNAITAVGANSITVGSECNVLGVTYSVLAFASGTDPAVLLTSIAPDEGFTTGGTHVVLTGVGFLSGMTVTFGGIAATDVVVISSTTATCVTPAHDLGAVDVVVTTTVGDATLAGAFTYIRPPSVRRDRLSIREAAGDAARTASFLVEQEEPGGSSEVKIGLEPTTLRLGMTIGGGTVAPGTLNTAVEPLLFDGVMGVVEQNYEGKNDQLAWSCVAVDRRYTLNKKRPFGSFVNIAAHTVVETIMGTYAPDFDLTYVQQIEVPITVAFDGTLTMAEALNVIRDVLGTSHWYVDGLVLHFYHLGVGNTGESPVSANPPPPDTTLTVVESASAATDFIEPGWYTFQVSYGYSSGLESQPSDLSGPLLVDGTKAIDFSTIPIGAPYAGQPVVRRYLYMNPLFGGVFKVYLQQPYKSYAIIIENNTDATYQLVGVPTIFDYIRRTPVARYENAPAPAAAPTFSLLGSGTVYSPAFQGSNPVTFTPGNYKWAVANVYANGVESSIGPESGDMACPTGTEDYWDFTFIPSGTPNSDGKPVVYRKLYARLASGNPLGLHSDTLNLAQMLVPNNTETQREWAFIAVTTAGSHYPPDPPGAGMWVGSGGDLWVHPDTYRFGQFYGLPTEADYSYGAYLEGALPQPDDITDANMDLLRDPPIRSSEDSTQLRTRVYVKGASTVLTVVALSTNTTLTVDNEDLFEPSGGQVLIGTVVATYTEVSSSGVLTLTEAIGAEFPVGTAVYIWVQVDDLEAQTELGSREQDEFGVPSDGIVEHTIVDPSLDTVQICATRGTAELILFSRPIVTVDYATRDRSSRAGRVVNISLTDPPIEETDLVIQEVTIDQLNVSPNRAVSPRFRVTASKVRFTIDDLMRRVKLS